MTDRQRKFAELYLQLGNKVEAAERAGFERSYAAGAMRQPEVIKYIAERRAEMQRRDVATTDEIMAFLTAVMRGEIEGERLERGATPRVKAAELLAERLGVRQRFDRVIDELRGVLMEDEGHNAND